MKAHYKKNIAILVICLLLFSITGCQKNPEKPSPEESKQETPQLPEVFTEMEHRILEIMYIIDGIPGIEKSIEEQKKMEIEMEVESGVEQTKEEKEAASKKKVNPEMYIMEESTLIPVLKEEEVESDVIKLQEPPGDIMEIWHQLQELVYQLHRQWNVVETHLKEVNVPEASLVETEGKLDQATLSLEAQTVPESMLNFNRILSDLSNYRGHYRHRVPSELYQLSYHVREIVLLASQDEYNRAIEDLNRAKELAEGLRPKLNEKNATNVVEKLMLSLEDLERELTTQDVPLVQMKAAIVMKNINMAVSPFESSTDES